MENIELQTKNQMYNCPYCLKEFSRLNTLKSHIKKIHLIYGIYCPYCLEIYGTITKLESHLALQNDEYHRNLYYLITGRYLKKVNKELLMLNKK